ncbi:uncharacterized protein [Typha angustifolia]|uniref:uncharacterized protein isoform X3 n=1 Tax=Typha angustifolia TaxID=59011 RepID=UPI003C2CB391
MLCWGIKLKRATGENFGGLLFPRRRVVLMMAISKNYMRCGSSSPSAVILHFASGNAWHLPARAYEAMRILKDAGVKLAVVSNFDTRLRKLLKDLKVAELFDAIVISSEVGYEKPAAEIFKIALDQIGVEAGKAVHVGDEEKADKTGANTIGLDCWFVGDIILYFSHVWDAALMCCGVLMSKLLMRYLIGCSYKIHIGLQKTRQSYHTIVTLINGDGMLCNYYLYDWHSVHGNKILNISKRT